MKLGISISIDVTKILKERLYQGKKGTYLDLTTFIDTEEVDQYENNGFISQSQTKEEREAGEERTPILGNCKVFYKDESNSHENRKQEYAKGTEQAKAAMAPGGFDDTDIPFAPFMKGEW